MLCRTVCWISCVYLTPRLVMIGNSVREWWASQKGHVVSVGKGAGTKPNAPMGFAPRARIPVSVGRGFHMQDHLVFGLVWRHGNDW